MFSQSSGNVAANLKVLEELKQEDPSMTHVYMRREDGVAVDIPLGHAEATINQHPTWTVEGSGTKEIELKVVTPKVLGEPVVAGQAGEELPLVAPPKPSVKKRATRKPKAEQPAE